MLWDHKACFKAALVITLLFSLIDVAAMAMPSDSTPFVRVINGSSDPANPTGYTMLEPGSSQTDGNWIILSGGNPVRIPALSVHYSGPGIINGSPCTVLSDWPVFSAFNVESNYLVNVSPHDMTVPFDTYPVYSQSDGKNNVMATFYGSNNYAGKTLTVKLLDLNRVSDKIDLTDVTTIKNTMKTLTLSDIKSTEIYSVDIKADGAGDIPSIESHIGGLSNMQQGHYALVVMDNSNANIPCIVAEAPIVVAKNTMDTTMFDPTPKPGDSITFIEDQQGATDGQYTYMVAMVPEANFTTDVNVTSDGTLSGTFVTFHGLSLNETLNVVSDGTEAGTTVNFDGLVRHEPLTKSDLENTDYMKQLAKDELAQSSIAFGVKNTTATTGVDIEVPTKDTMPTGKYVVLAVAVDRNTGLVSAINQTYVNLGVTYDLNLKKGWNLVSIPIVPNDNSIGAIFTSAQLNNIWVIWAYAPTDPNNYYGWDYYTPLSGYTPTLNSINYREGYWIYCYNDMTVQINGNYPVDNTIAINQLNSGWNLIGYPNLTPRNPATIYNDVSKVWVVWDYYPSDPNAYYGWDYYTPLSGYSSTLATLQPGKGYWIYIK